MQYSVVIGMTMVGVLLTAAVVQAGGYGQPPGTAGEGATGVATGVDCLDCVTLGVETQGSYAASSAEAGPATSALSLTANGGNCPAGQAPLGIDATGASESCFDIATQAELDTHAALTGTAHGATAAATPNTLVARDGFGEFSAATVTASTFQGLATSALTLNSNPSNCAIGTFPAGITANGQAETCTDLATQTEFTTHVGNLASGGNAVRVTNSTGISVPNATNYCLPLDTEYADVSGWHSTAANTSRITAGLAGWYLITGNVQWAVAQPVGARFVNIKFNGVTEIAAEGGPAPDMSQIRLMNVATLYYLALGEYVELCVYHEASVSATIDASPQRSPILALTRLGP